MTTAHLLYPTVLTFRRISARHDLRPRVVQVANENPRLSSAADRRGILPPHCDPAGRSFPQVPARWWPQHRRSGARRAA